MFEIVMAIITVALVIVVILAFIIGPKNDVTYKNHKIITDAIYDYHIDMLMSKKYDQIDAVDYRDMETYNSTLFRLWDWGYTRILPKEKFEIVKPYIE